MYTNTYLDVPMLITVNTLKYQLKPQLKWVGSICECFAYPNDVVCLLSALTCHKIGYDITNNEMVKFGL